MRKPCCCIQLSRPCEGLSGWICSRWGSLCQRISWTPGILSVRRLGHTERQITSTTWWYPRVAARNTGGVEPDDKEKLKMFLHKNQRDTCYTANQPTNQPNNQATKQRNNQPPNQPTCYTANHCILGGRSIWIHPSVQNVVHNLFLQEKIRYEGWMNPTSALRYEKYQVYEIRGKDYPTSASPLWSFTEIGLAFHIWKLHRIWRGVIVETYQEQVKQRYDRGMSSHTLIKINFDEFLISPFCRKMIVYQQQQAWEAHGRSQIVAPSACRSTGCFQRCPRSAPPGRRPSSFPAGCWPACSAARPSRAAWRAGCGWGWGRACSPRSRPPCCWGTWGAAWWRPPWRCCRQRAGETTGAAGWHAEHSHRPEHITAFSFTGQMRRKIWAQNILGEDRDDVLSTLRQASTKGVALKSSSSIARCRMVL